jgi:hypothetical protein
MIDSVGMSDIECKALDRGGDFWQEWVERAAIKQHCAGMTIAEAEQSAWDEVGARWDALGAPLPPP